MTESKKIRILLADDEKHVRQLVKAILLPLNGEIVGEAENGEEAVKLYSELRPDFVLLDVNMPVKDGKAALREIIAIDPRAVVVMLTSMSDVATVQQTIEGGASSYIRKDTSPVQVRELLKEIWKEYLPGTSA